MLPPPALAEFEAACDRLALGVGRDRVEAEEYLMKMRRADEALMFARAVIDCSLLPSAHFQAACMMQDAVLKDWNKVPLDHRNELKGHIIRKVLEGTCNGTMKPFVRSKLLQVFAVIVKRTLCEKDSPDLMTELVSYVQTLMAEQATRVVGMYILLAVLQEFSSNTRSVAGLSWEFHHMCQQRINKDGHLKLIFVSISSLLAASMDTLRQHSANLPAAAAADGVFNWLEPCAAVLNQIFAWDFTDSEAKGGVMGSFKMSRGDIISPGVAWRDVFVQPATLDLFYSAYAACRQHQTLAHPLRQCLIDLAGIRGDVFPDDISRQAYFEHSMACVLALLHPQADDSESVDVALILQRLTTNFPSTFVMRSANASTHLQQICGFTCMLMQQSCKVEDVCWQEALDHVLELWAALCNSLMLIENGQTMLSAISAFSGKIFRCFVEKCMQEAQSAVEDWDEDAEEHEDNSVLDERLTAVGCIGRPLASDSVPLLEQSIVQRVEGLRSLLREGRPVSEKEISTVLEQLHWLVRIAGHLVADEGEGEVPCIPELLSALSHEAGQLAAQGGASPTANGATAHDPIVKLTNGIVQLVQFQDESRTAGRADLCSPLLAQTCTWFFCRWTQTYLLPTTSERFPVSSNLQALYGTPQGAQSVLHFLVSRAHVNLDVWGTEDDVLNATCALLLALVGRKQVGRLLVVTEGWLDLAAVLNRQLEQPRSVRVLPPVVLEKTVQSLCGSIAGLEEQQQKSAMLKGVIAPVRQHLDVMIERAKAHGGSWVQGAGGDGIHAALSMLQGACKAGDFYTFDTSFDFVAPILPALPPILEACGDRNDLVGGIVQLYVAIAEFQVSFLSAQQMHAFNEACLQLLRTFAHVEEGAAHSTESNAFLRELKATWLRDHLLSLLQLLLHLARKDVVDFATEARAMDVADVVLYGLSIVQPLVTPESLQFPPLATEFFGLLGWLVESYPQKVSVMSRDILDPMMACLAHGVQQADSDIARVSVEAIDALATFQIGTMQGSTEYLLKRTHPQMLGLFLQSMLEMLLFKQFNRGVLEASCDALHSLMWCEQHQFHALMTQVMEQQAVMSHREEVSRATETLLKVVTESGPALQRSAKMQFRKHMRDFLGSVRPFLVKI